MDSKFPNTPPSGKNFSIIALILGICSSALFLSFFMLIYSPITAITGLVLGIIGKKQCNKANTPSKMAVVGIVLNVVVLVLCVIATIIVTLLLSQPPLPKGG